MKPTPRLKRALIMLSCASLLLAFGALASGETADALLRRYPYDPACPWGRIGNGKGLIVRCLTEAEAQALRAGAVPAPNSSAPPATSSNTSAPAVTATASSATAATPPVAPPDEPSEPDAGVPPPRPATRSWTSRSAQSLRDYRHARQSALLPRVTST